MKFSLAFALAFTAFPLWPAAAGEPAKPVNLEKANTDADEDNPFAAADGMTLLYDSNKSGRFEIMASRRTASSQAWGAGAVFVAAKTYDCRSPFLRGNILYFAHNKVPDETLKDLQNFDLQQKSGTMAPLPLLGISEEQDELHPWITQAGKEFYFSRKLKDGWTLFVANGPVPGPVGKARRVGFGAGFCHATLAGNGLTMYLQGPLEKDRVGLYKSKRASAAAAWSVPEPVGGLNHAEAKRGDMSPCLTADGARLYFASDRPGGKGGLDIWTIALKDVK